jgi:hypothetical protein
MLRLFAIFIVGISILLGRELARNAVQAPVGIQAIVTIGLLLLIGPPTLILYRASLKRTRATFTRRFGRWSTEDIWTFTGLVVVGPIIALATLTTILISRGVITATAAGNGPIVLAADPILADKVFDVYWWNLADAVPIVKIPDTLGWKPSIDLSIGGALLVLLFKLALILPMVQLAGELLKNMFGAPDRDGTPE